MFDQFFKSEAASGILLMSVTVLALVIANSPLAPLYFDALHLTLGGLSLLHWINDGLMALFFLLVGLEIRHELSHGELASWHARALPGLCALGGMAVPAAVYVAFNLGEGGRLEGWATPTATDIAFSLGVLALFGARAPASLKIFLTALAIIDDLFAVLIIALFYGSGLSLLFLALATLVLAVLVLLSRMGVTRLWAYLLLGAVLWLLVLKSGLHATLAGVVLAFVIPSRGHAVAQAPTHRLEHALSFWVAFVIVPLFAFANAGVSLAGLSLQTLMQPVTLGVAAGLLLGKQIGVFGAAWVGVKLGLGRLPQGASWLSIYAVAALCGIGFTISLFIGTLAFDDEGAQSAAKLGVLMGSLLAGGTGWLLLRLASQKPV
jgi:NhaA family Na+:H+ antiporter